MSLPPESQGDQSFTPFQYELQERLGAGAVGVVYRARDRRLNRFIVLKFLRPELTEDAGARERFVREAQAASALEHPNVATVHEVNETPEGRLYIAMAYYEGETLQERINRGALPIPEMVEVATQIARGLAAAHRLGIVHRDVKPANVILTNDGQVRIVDFGLAKLAGQARLTGIGTVVGTAAYMAPEQAQGDAGDHRSDLWSLGVVLYEMATGQLPFSGEYAPAMIYSVLNHEPTPASELRPELPPALVRIIERALAKDPDRRFQSTDELVEALAAVETETLASAGAWAKPAPSRFGRLRRRWRWVAAVVGFALALLAVVYATGSRRRTASESMFRTLAVLPFANFTDDAGRDYFCEGLSSFLISRLSELPGLSVVSRSEAWQYRQSSKSPRDVAEELGVGVIVEGGVQQAGDRLQVDVHLTAAAQGVVLWSDVFVGDREQIFELQARIARQIAAVLSVPLSLRDRLRLASDPTRSLQAFDEYLKGVQLLEEVDNAQAPGQSAEHFRRAVSIDPEFALAHAGRSEALLWLYETTSQSDALSEAEREAMVAVGLDAELPEARLAMAEVLRATGRYVEAVAELEAILLRQPTLDAAHMKLAGVHTEQGELEAAEASLRSALARRPDYWRYWNELGRVLVDGGDYDTARTCFERAAALVPAEEATWPYHNLATVAVLRGDYEGAVAAYQHIPEEGRDAVWESNIGTAQFFAGRLEEAEAHYLRAVSLDPADPLLQQNLGDLYLRQGEPGRARRRYGEALNLIERQLADNPQNDLLRLDRALYLAKLGQCDGATQAAQDLEDELAESADAAHILALTYASCGQRSAALEAVTRAVQKGFSAELILQEDEFGDLRSDPDFLAIASREGAAEIRNSRQ